MTSSKCPAPSTGPAIRGLADLDPKVLATMHGSSFDGDAPRALRELADLYDELRRRASPL